MKGSKVLFVKIGIAFIVISAIIVAIIQYREYQLRKKSKDFYTKINSDLIYKNNMVKKHAEMYYAIEDGKSRLFLGKKIFSYDSLGKLIYTREFDSENNEKNSEIYSYNKNDSLILMETYKGQQNLKDYLDWKVVREYHKYSPSDKRSTRSIYECPVVKFMTKDFKLGLDSELIYKEEIQYNSDNKKTEMDGYFGPRYRHIKRMHATYSYNNESQLVQIAVGGNLSDKVEISKWDYNKYGMLKSKTSSTSDKPLTGKEVFTYNIDSNMVTNSIYVIDERDELKYGGKIQELYYKNGLKKSRKEFTAKGVKVKVVVYKYVFYVKDKEKEIQQSDIDESFVLEDVWGN